MSNPRRVEAAFTFNGQNVTSVLNDYLESVTYTDVASGSSDQLDIVLQNIGGEWLGQWYPVKGDKVSGSFTFLNWNSDGDRNILPLGSFTMDEISFSGGPMTAKFGCVAVPNDESFRVLERTKTWKNVTVQGIGQEIASRYGMELKYSGKAIMIKSLEQSDKTDCSFLYEICSDYGLSMKVFAGAITIYDQTEIEQEQPVETIRMDSFIGGRFDYVDTLVGIYTGAKITYKTEKNDKEIKTYVGLKGENDPGSRVLRISETANDQEEAYLKAAAKVNKSNQDATKLSGNIFPNFRICAGVTILVEGMGKADGKYFVDRSVISIDGSGTSQKIEMHKCQARLLDSPVPSGSGGTIGEIVSFKGGTHYTSSYAGAKGYKAKPGPAKITAVNEKGAHPYHLIHTDSSSNVYGWVDPGTF